MNTMHTAAPVVKIENPVLVTWGRETSEFGSRSMVKVARPTIYWIRQTETHIEFSHGGKILYTGSTFCDSLYATSIKNAFDRFLDQLEDYEIDRESTLLVEGICKVRDIPVKKSTEKPYGRLNKAYDHIDDLWWFVEDTSRLTDITMIDNYQDLLDLDLPKCRMRVIEEIIPFSSKMTLEENTKNINDLICKFQSSIVDLDPPESKKTNSKMF
jgi:hypothetical protein